MLARARTAAPPAAVSITKKIFSTAELDPASLHVPVMVEPVCGVASCGVAVALAPVCCGRPPPPSSSDHALVVDAVAWSCGPLPASVCHVS